MFLQPQHFQQESRYVERLVEAHAASLSPHGWGFLDLQLDEALLAKGQVGLARAAGLLPDGTPYGSPQFDPLPEPLEIGADVKNELIVLALPLQREGAEQFRFDGQAGSATTRYAVQQEEVRDNTLAGDEPVTIQTGLMRFRLMRARDTLDAYAKVGVAWVSERRPDGMVVLDRQYIAPQVRLDASAQLSSSVELLQGVVRKRAETIASRMGQLGQGVSELAEFLLLQTLNRHEPVLAQHVASPSAHPRELHRDCLRLAGDLATLALDSRVVPSFPPYRHDDLQGCFMPVFDELRRMLSIQIDAQAERIELVDRKRGVRTAVIQDLSLVRHAGFVLAVNAQVPAEHLRHYFPAQTKIGPVDRIRDLVNLQLPGIGLRALPVAPRQLPFHAGYYYFELERGGEMWAQLERDGNVAMHVAGDFPGLELEFWAIRR